MLLLSTSFIQARPIQCGDNNHNINDPSETLYFSAADLEPFPCHTIIIRDSSVRRIIPSPDQNPIFLQRLEIRDVTVATKIDLKLGFFSDIHNNNNTTNTASTSSETTSTSVLFRRVRIQGFTKNATHEFLEDRPLSIFNFEQFLITNTTSQLFNRQYKQQHEDQVTQFFADKTQIQSASQDYLTNVLARNFIDSFIIDDCYFVDSDDSNTHNRTRTNSKSNIKNLMIGKQFIMNHTQWRVPLGGFSLRKTTALDQSFFLFSNNVFKRDDSPCDGDAKCIAVVDDGGSSNEQIDLVIMNNDVDSASLSLVLRLASKTHHSELGIGVIFEGNEFLAENMKVPEAIDQPQAVSVDYFTMGGTVSEQEYQEMKNANNELSTIAVVETENSDSDYFEDLLINKKKKAHGFIFHRNVIRQSIYNFGSGVVYDSVQNINLVRINDCPSIPRMLFLRNSISSNREIKLRGITLMRLALVPGGVAFIENTFDLNAVSEKYAEVLAIELYAFGFHPDKYSDPPPFATIPFFDSPSSSSSFDPRTTVAVIISSNTIHLSCKVTGDGAHMNPFVSTDIAAILSLKLYTLSNVKILSISNITSFMSLETPSSAVSFMTGVGSFEGHSYENVSSIEVKNCNFTGAGNTASATGLGFENNHFVDVHSVVFSNTLVDYSRVFVQTIDNAASMASQAKAIIQSPNPSSAMYKQFLVAVRSAVVHFALLTMDNAGADLVRIENNTFYVQQSSKNELASTITLALVQGRCTASPTLQPELSQTYPPYNTKAQFFFQNNNMRVFPPSPLSPNDEYFPSSRISILFFSQIFDMTPSITSMSIENNNLETVDGSGGLMILFSSAGSFHPTSFVVVRNNTVRSTSSSSSSIITVTPTNTKYVVLQGVKAVRSTNLEFPASYADWAPMPVFHSLISLTGSGNNLSFSSTSQMMIVEGNTMIIEQGFGRVMGISSAPCGYYYHDDDEECGFSGKILFRNNTMKFTPNSQLLSSSSSSSFTGFELFQLGKVDSMMINRDLIQQVDLIENVVEFEGVSKNNNNDENCTLLSALPLQDLSLVSSLQPQSLTTPVLNFARNNITFKNCKTSFFAGPILPPSVVSSSSTSTPSTLFQQNQMFVSSSSTSSFIQIPSSSLLDYPSEITLDQNEISVLAELESNLPEEFDISFIRQSNQNFDSSSQQQSSSIIIFTSNHIKNPLDDITNGRDVSTHYAFQKDNNQQQSTSSFSFSLQGEINKCNSISMKHVEEINPDFETAIESDNDVTFALSQQCKNFAGKNKTSNQNSINTNNKTKTRSKEAENSDDDDVDYSPLLQTSNNALGSIGMVTSSAAAAIVPSMGFGISRQQAMVGFIQSINDGDCSGVSTSDTIAAADSPTQLSIGTSEARFYVGGAVGNTILSFGFCLLVQACGAIFLKVTGSSSWNRPYSVFARCHVAMIMFICMSLLFAPTIKFGLVAVTLPSVPIGEKVLTVVFSLLFFLLITAYYNYWSLFGRERKEAYRRIHPLSKKEQDSLSFFARTFNFWFEGPGEWRMPMKNSKYGKSVTEKDHLNFDAATPMLDGYQGHAYWFGLFEFVIQFFLAFAEFLAQVVPSEKSCVTQGVVLFIVFSLYLIFTLWLRPYQELFNRIVTPIVTLFEIVILALAFYFKDAGRQPDFIVQLAVAAVSMQSFVSLVVFVASLSPIFKSAMKVYKRLRKEKRRNTDKNGRPRSKSTIETFRQALLVDDDKEEQDIELKKHRQLKVSSPSSSANNKKPNSTKSSSPSRRNVANKPTESRKNKKDDKPRKSRTATMSSNHRGSSTSSNRRDRPQESKIILKIEFLFF